MGTDPPPAPRPDARPHRPGRRLPAAAVRPAPVTHRRHDHRPDHHPRRPGTRPTRPPRRPRPRQLGIVLTDLIRGGRTHTGTGSPSRTSWLFPGGMPGRPVTPVPARRTAPRPRRLRHARTPGRAHRPCCPAARRRPRRPARPGPGHRSPMDAPGRRRLVQLRSRPSTNPASPTMTNAPAAILRDRPIQHGW